MEIIVQIIWGIIDMKKPATRVIEINVHRSHKHPKLGHAVAMLFPCSHNKYLGFTLYKGEVGTEHYRTQDCRVIKFEDYEINDKEYCKLCPPDEFWIDSLDASVTLDDVVDMLEAIEDF
jgi:hypothetical protein